MLALAHSHAGREVWGFEWLITRGLAERPGRNVESLEPPKSAKRLAARWRVGRASVPRRTFEADLPGVLLAYGRLRDWRDALTLVQAQFGQFASVDR